MPKKRSCSKSDSSSSKCPRTKSSLVFTKKFGDLNVIEEEENEKVCRKELPVKETENQPEKKKRGRPKRTSARFKSKFDKAENQKEVVKCKDVKPKEENPEKNKPQVKRGRPARIQGNTLDNVELFGPNPEELDTYSNCESRTLRSNTVDPVYNEGKESLAAMERYESKEFQDNQEENQINCPRNTAVEHPSTTCPQISQCQQVEPSNECDSPTDLFDGSIRHVELQSKLVLLTPQNNLQLYFSITVLGNMLLESDILDGLMFNTRTTLKQSQLFFNFQNLEVQDCDLDAITVREAIDNIKQLEI